MLVMAVQQYQWNLITLNSTLNGYNGKFYIMYILQQTKKGKSIYAYIYINHHFLFISLAFSFIKPIFLQN